MRPVALKIAHGGRDRSGYPSYPGRDVPELAWAGVAPMVQHLGYAVQIQPLAAQAERPIPLAERSSVARPRGVSCKAHGLAGA
jgi:hypothetical protein